ncbi:MAG: hypothetical protein K2Q09_07860 [Phycisphaerales bacterium]|nr:hypothetical protein [Phycisphaerales bacterium]
MPRRYSKKASKKVERAMHERKRGTLRSGRSGKKVTSRKQAIAIGLSEARREGDKVPGSRSGSRAGSKSGSRSGGSSRSGGRSRSSSGGR